MEAFALYLLKSVVWLAGFTLVFMLFLRNERFFLLNRFYLLGGILISFLFPLISIHYTVEIPIVRNFQIGNAVLSNIQNQKHSIFPDLKQILLILYVSGVLFVLALITKQGIGVVRAIRKSEIISFQPAKLIKTPRYTSAFSFFSYVFVNPSVTDVETKEIMIHELVHIRQKHWFDLLLVELLCTMQWFNPLVWIYIRFIRQNHEYLADEVALQQTSDPAVYRAVLLNQIVGSPVVSLANSFTYSPNKKRFYMMKNIINSPYRKMKILLILPVFAIVLYAFAKPEYKYNYMDENSGNIVSDASLQQKSVKGTVLRQDGKPLAGATITVTGTTTGTISDAKGNFKLDNVPDGGLLAISFVGFKYKVLKPVFTSDMEITMAGDTIKVRNSNIRTPSSPPPPPPLPEDIMREANAKDVPPPPAPFSIINLRKDGPPPLLVVDGIIMPKSEVDKIPPETIGTMTIMKDETAIAKYGEKGKDGVIELFTRKATTTLITESGKKDTIKVIGYGGVLFETNENKPVPLYVLDGVVITKDDLDKADPQSFELINNLKAEAAITKYGEKGKDGAIEITTKKYYFDGTGNKKSAVKVIWDTSAPPPSFYNSGIRSGNGANPLFVVDGIVEGKDFDLKSVNPDDIESIQVLKNKSAVELYGGKAENGVILIATKKTGSAGDNSRSEIKVTGYADKKSDKSFVVMEQMPVFPGGESAMATWITSNLKYPGKAVKDKIEGNVPVNFLITSKGKVKDVKVLNSVNPLLDKEAERLISGMPDWKPGLQGGKPVDVQMVVTVNFKLK